MEPSVQDIANRSKETARQLHLLLTKNVIGDIKAASNSAVLRSLSPVALETSPPNDVSSKVNPGHHNGQE
jgi:hypothetical protein